MSDYFLTSARLGFRTWTRADLPLALSLWGDPEVTRLFTREPWSAERVAARLEEEIRFQETEGMQYWPMFMLADGAFAGVCGLKPYRRAERIPILGFHLMRSAWGQGIAGEAARAVIGHAFRALPVAALFAGHHPDHHASRRILEKLGFRHTGEQLYEPTGLMDRVYLLTAAEAADRSLS